MLDSDRDRQKNYQEKKQLKEKVAFRKTVKKSLKTVIIWTTAILTVLFTAGGVFFSVRKSSQGNVDAQSLIAPFVQMFPEQGRTHIPEGQKITNYNSNPPTSGDHYGEPASWGIYDKELPDEKLVHNLEHCGIWISYRPDISQDLKTKLTDFAKGYPSKLIMTPRAKDEKPIAIAAWQRLMVLDGFDAQKLDAFVASFINQAGPECQAP